MCNNAMNNRKAVVCNNKYDAAELVTLLEMYSEECESYRLETLIIGALMNRTRLRNIIERNNWNDICLVGGTILANVAERCFSEFISVRQIGQNDGEIVNYKQFNDFKTDDSLIKDIGDAVVIVTSLREEETIISALSKRMDKSRLFRINEIIGW